MLAPVQGHAFAVLAQPHEREAEVGLDALLVVVQTDQLAADVVREERADDGVDERRPHEIARNTEAPELRGAGQAP